MPSVPSVPPACIRSTGIPSRTVRISPSRPSHDDRPDSGAGRGMVRRRTFIILFGAGLPPAAAFITPLSRSLAAQPRLDYMRRDFLYASPLVPVVVRGRTSRHHRLFLFTMQRSSEQCVSAFLLTRCQESTWNRAPSQLTCLTYCGSDAGSSGG